MERQVETTKAVALGLLWLRGVIGLAAIITVSTMLRYAREGNPGVFVVAVILWALLPYGALLLVLRRVPASVVEAGLLGLGSCLVCALAFGYLPDPNPSSTAGLVVVLVPLWQMLGVALLGITRAAWRMFHREAQP